jgi:hypothetical protein
MRRLLAISTAALLLPACSTRNSTTVPESRVEVVAVEVGRAVGADKRVTAPADTFAPDDTIYVSVVTEGAADDVTLSARWTRHGERLEETAQRIAPEGTAVSEFHVLDPTGWAPGAYRVEILLDGHVVGDRAFRVEGARNASKNP